MSDEHVCNERDGEALTRVLAVRDLLKLVLWAEVELLPGIETAIAGLQNARNIVRARLS